MKDNNVEFTDVLPKYLLFKFAFDMCSSIVLIPFILIWFLGVGNFICNRYAKSIKCKLTDNCLYWTGGILFNEEKIIPLDKIQDIIIIKGPVLEYFGINAINIKTDKDSISLYSVKSSESFRDDLINRQREYLIKVNSSSQVVLLENILLEVTNIRKQVTQE